MSGLYIKMDKEMDISDTTLKYEPIAYRFRFTFTDQDNEHEYAEQLPRFKHIAKDIKSKLVDLYHITHITGGLEQLDKYGARTFAHVHFHFYSTANKDTMIRAIKNMLKDKYDQQTTGVKRWCFKEATDLRDKERFYRYPLKQVLMPELCSGFTKEELLHYHEVAKDVDISRIQFNSGKEGHMDEKNSIFERLTEKFKNQNPKVSERFPLLKLATQLYVEEGRPINKQTIQGYVDCYMLKEKLISYEDFWA